jgi:acetyl-CoA acetyltransferase
MSCAIVGLGRTEFSRCSGRTPLAMAVEACRGALDEAGLVMGDVDGIGTFQWNDSALPVDVGWALGRDELSWAPALLGGGNFLAAVVSDAAAAIESGQCKAVLVYRSLNGRSGFRFGTVTDSLPVADKAQYDAPAGLLVPAQYVATWARRHMEIYGSTCEDLGQIAVTQRRHAQRNSHAIAQDPLSLAEYMNGRWVADPFRVYDCAYEVDGAVALLIADADVVPDCRTEPVWLLGSANSLGGSGWTGWDDMTTMYSRVAGPRLWRRIGLGPQEIDVALMYDCFTYTVMATMEDFGFCGKGDVGAFFAEGRATYGGDVVVNPHGGLLSEGYLHGLNHHYEAAVQLRGAAGDRQVQDARLALVTAGAGPFGGAVVYSRDRP